MALPSVAEEEEKKKKKKKKQQPKTDGHLHRWSSKRQYCRSRRR